MGGKKGTKQRRLWEYAKAGASAGLFSILLLLPGALLIFLGYAKQEHSTVILAMTVLAATILGQYIFHEKKEKKGVLLRIIVSEGVYILIIILSSLSLPGGVLEWERLVSILCVSTIGNSMGSLMQINKLYNHKNRRRGRYT